MDYQFRTIEKKWQQRWKETNAYKVTNPSPGSGQAPKPKYYVLDMFPYPSGAGLHVGHPLGYIASDIYARYKRLKGFNVLHPMGYDSFGLPAEQYALETGQHPAVTTEKNIDTFRKQLDNIGFSYDWSREVRTSDPKYYRWTQWIFLQLYNSYFCNTEKKALPISKLIKKYETKGAMPKTGEPIPGKHFTAEQWNAFSEKEKEDILTNRRLAYLAYGEVNWCEALGTVLANDEVINGVSERGGHPVVKKKMRQWYLRITAYAERLLQGLDTVEFSEAMKEMQRNWIGKSEGAEITFAITAPSQPSPAGKEHLPTEPVHYTADPSMYRITKELSIEKRHNPTAEESLLWKRLNGNQLGIHFRRQHIIGSFIVDFVCIDKMLTIEVDGGYHNDPEQKQYDECRTEYLKEKGFKEIRFTNSDVRNNIEAVISKIKEQLELQSSHTKSKQNKAAKVSPAGGDLEGALGVRVYTTRPDTIFGVDFMVLAPEHDLVSQITTIEQKEEIKKYLTYVKSRSDRERMAEVKQITGAFTGAYAINPFNKKQIPIWISEYVLAGYGTGAIMAVPSGDQRDFNFAKHFNIPITNIIGEHYTGEEANATKEATLTNSDFLNGMLMKDAIGVVIDKLEALGIGKRKINYKMRDAGFSRQRYWGEPFPIVYKEGIAYPVNELPVELPHVENYKPGPEGQGPLANIPEWVHYSSPEGGGWEGARETNTMPGYAGSSWYFLRYADPHNENEFADKKATDYWNQVDVYVGGTEHAVGHLLYSRMWTKVLFDLGFISFDEPFKKLLNQGMIQGSSRFVYQIIVKHKETDVTKDPLEVALFISDKQFSLYKNGMLSYVDIQNKINENSTEVQWGIDRLPKDYINDIVPRRVNVDLVNGVELDIDKFRKSKPEFANAVLLCEDGKVSEANSKLGNDKYICGVETEKMSKSKYNVVNPDEIIEKYGADTFRMYEMFLGPVEASKPWDTKGIEGVHRFLRKLWRLFYDDVKGKIWNEENATDAELKVLHRTIKKIEEDTERFSYNTAVSAFMVCVNELHDLKCNKKEILQPVLILLNPYAPHITAELWQELGNESSILDAAFPAFDAKFLVESSKEYPVSINGKMRTTININLDASREEVQQIVTQNEVIKKWIEGKPIKKLIYVKGKMINLVI